MDKIHTAAGLIGDAYAIQIAKFGENQSSKQYLTHKLKHTFAVFSNIMDIYVREKSLINNFSQDEVELLQLAAILHDLGRFYQFKDAGIHIKNSEFDHGKEAVKMLSDNQLFNNPIILFAIAEHNQFMVDYESLIYTSLSEKDKVVADKIVKLLRDADKLENIEDFCFNGVPFINLPVLPLSEEIVETIKEGGLIHRSNIKTASDMVVDFIGWLDDINFDATMDKIRILKFFDKAILELKKNGASDDDVKLVQDNIGVRYGF